MIVDRDTTKLLIETMARRVIASAQELTELDRAIGDGDHGINMERGFEAVLAQVDQLAAQGLGNALIGVGTTLVLKVGGASGPLYGTLFMALGKAWPAEATREQVTEALARARRGVQRPDRRGCRNGGNRSGLRRAPRRRAPHRRRTNAGLRRWDR